MYKADFEERMEDMMALVVRMLGGHTDRLDTHAEQINALELELKNSTKDLSYLEEALLGASRELGKVEGRTR